MMAHSRFFGLWLPTTLLTFLAPFATAQSCYYPDGTAASSDVPCDSSAPYTACCGPDAYCTDNGLCISGAVYARGSCTDQSWTNDACPQYCKAVNPSGGEYMTPCSTTTFACGLVSGANGNICDNNFTMTGGTQIVLRDEQVAALGLSSALTLAPTEILPSTICAAQTTVTVTATAGLRFSTVITSTGAGATVSSSASADGRSSSSDVGAIAGGTVGGVVAAGILGALLVYFLMRRKKKARTNATREIQQR